MAAFVLAATVAFSAYMLIDLSRFDGKFSSLWFLAILPAFLSALICYIGDPSRTRGSGFYWVVPIVLVTIVCVGSIVFLREGVVCLIMLVPIWLVTGWIGAFVLRNVRGRVDDNSRLRSSLLALPLLLGLVENSLPFPHQDFEVTRHIVIHASPDQVWRYAVENPHIDPSEGHWTFSQNVAGLARPRATVMQGEGTGAIRTAYWGDHIHFDEVITGWEPNRRLAWDFRFNSTSLQDYTDKHISPDGAILSITSGDYTLESLNAGTTRLILRTRYTARTHVNLYTAIWGEIFLGDVQSNVLTIIKDRAERRHREVVSD